MSINIVAPQPASFNPSAPLVELETQLRTAVACADASNKTAAALILHMIEQRQQSVRSIARTVGKSPSWVHAMLTWARDDFQDDPFSRSKRVQPAEQPEPKAKPEPEANEAEASAERRKAENAAAWPEPEPDFGSVERTEHRRRGEGRSRGGGHCEQSKLALNMFKRQCETWLPNMTAGTI